MKKLLKKDKILRKNFSKKKIFKIILSSISKNPIVKTSTIWNINYFISTFLSKVSYSRLKNCCFFTGKSLSLNLKLKVSRIFFLKTAKKLEFYGYRKLVW